jgi:fructuronate reductase
MVADVRPFEEMKLRLLNGSHSAIAYLGLLSGHATVAEAFADPAIRGFVERLWREAIPTLPAGAGLDPHDYVKQLARRYANAALAHQTRQIANDGSQKLPQRIIAAALERLRDNATAGYLALVVAAWIAACAARGAALPAGHFTDPLDEPLGALVAWPAPERELVDAIFDLAGFAAGESQRTALVAMVAAHLEILRDKGAAAALACDM